MNYSFTQSTPALMLTDTLRLKGNVGVVNRNWGSCLHRTRSLCWSRTFIITLGRTAECEVVNCYYNFRLDISALLTNPRLTGNTTRHNNHASFLDVRCQCLRTLLPQDCLYPRWLSFLTLSVLSVVNSNAKAGNCLAVFCISKLGIITDSTCKY